MVTDIQKVGRFYRLEQNVFCVRLYRFYQPTKSADFCMTDDRFCWLILSAEKISQLHRSSDISFSLIVVAVNQ